MTTKTKPSKTKLLALEIASRKWRKGHKFSRLDLVNKKYTLGVFWGLVSRLMDAGLVEKVGRQKTGNRNVTVFRATKALGKGNLNNFLP